MQRATRTARRGLSIAGCMCHVAATRTPRCHGIRHTYATDTRYVVAPPAPPSVPKACAVRRLRCFLTPPAHSCKFRPAWARAMAAAPRHALLRAVLVGCSVAGGGARSWGAGGGVSCGSAIGLREPLSECGPPVREVPDCPRGDQAPHAAVHGGRRSYCFYAPKRAASAASVPLLIYLHSEAANVSQVYTQTGLRALAEHALRWPCRSPARSSGRTREQGPREQRAAPDSAPPAGTFTTGACQSSCTAMSPQCYRL